MKKLLLSLFAIANLTVFAQVTDSTVMGMNYDNDVFYSLATGTVKAETRSNWHLAFTTVVVDAAVLINEGLGVELYLASNDTSDWASIDTTNMTWSALHNSMSTWSEGAFNDGATVHPDYGWGTYNNVNHNVYGSKIFVLKLPDGSFKKVMIISMLTSGDFNFKIADLDGSNEISKTINKMAYNTKNFVYYDIENDLVVDREPAKGDWDIVWTRYYDVTIPYGVVGIQLNPAVKAAKASDVDTATVDWNMHPTTDSVSVIGSDWKYYDFNAGAYTVGDSVAMFIESQDGNLYKMLFKSFTSGFSSNATTVFTKSIVSAIGLDENTVLNVEFYPNPAADILTVEMANSRGVAEMFSMTGSTVLKTELSLGVNSVDVSALTSGVYLLRVTSNGKVGISRVVVQ